MFVLNTGLKSRNTILPFIYYDEDLAPVISLAERMLLLNSPYVARLPGDAWRGEKQLNGECGGSGPPIARM
jgi:hypothetical protein